MIRFREQWAAFGWLARLHLRAVTRGVGIRALGLLALLAAVATVLAQPGAAGMNAVQLGQSLGSVLGFAACFWFAHAALLDGADQRGPLLRSKPIPGPRWVLLCWGTGLVLWCGGLIAIHAIAAAVDAPRSGLVASAIAYGMAALHHATTVAIVGTASFALSRLARSPLGGIIVALGWFCVTAGMQFVPAYLRPDSSFNRGLFLPAVAALLLAVAAIVEPLRRGERLPRSAWAGVATCVALAGAGALPAVRASVPEERWPLAEAIARQQLQEGEAIPGFWLPDVRGNLVRLGAYPRQILLVFLFPADHRESFRTLQDLEQVRHEFGAHGVQPVGVCLANDPVEARVVVAATRVGFPIAIDPTTTRASPPAASALVEAYEATDPPVLVITDRRHRVRHRFQWATPTLGQLRAVVRGRIAEEPATP